MYMHGNVVPQYMKATQFRTIKLTVQPAIQLVPAPCVKGDPVIYYFHSLCWMIGCSE